MKKVRDHYFHRAKREGFAARSVFKLEEIDRRRRLLRPGMRVLDLGCAPGSWLQYAAQKTGAKGTVVGVDLSPVSIPLPAHAVALTGDVFEMTPGFLPERTAPFDVILSDMAPATSGIKHADAARSGELARRALELSGHLLKPEGSLLVKVFQGAGTGELRKDFAARFEQVTLEKPKASRGESVEVFLLGRKSWIPSLSHPGVIH